MKNFSSAALLSIGLAMCGYFISQGIQGWASNNRIITVKGVSEREVKEDQAFWPVKFSVNGSNLQSAQLALEAHYKRVIDYLTSEGIQFKDIAPQAIEVNDAKLNPYGNSNYRAGDTRIIITQTLLVSSNEPQKVLQSSRNINKLISQGVSVSVGAEYQGAPTYVFTKLNKHKPEMIADAIGSANLAAQRFTDESDTKLGAMKRGSQGVFTILPKHRFVGAEQSKQIEKTLRVVSTVSYYID